MRAAVAVLLVAACGRVDFDPVATADGGFGMGPFANARPVAVLASTVDDDDPAVSGDGLELYFASKRTGVSKIWVSRRSSRNDNWSAPEQVLELSVSTDDKGPALSADNLSIFFETGGNIAMATRPDRTSTWSQPVTVLDETIEVGTPAICDHGLRMYLREGTFATSEHLYTSQRPSPGAAWATPTAVPELNSAAADAGPWLSEDCNRVYFDSTRETNGMVYFAERGPSADTFGVPLQVPELKAMIGAVHDVSLTADERYIVFAHTTSSSIVQIYEASR